MGGATKGRRTVVLVVGVLLGVGALAPSSASAFEPIEGVWSPKDDLAVEILWQQTTPGTFHERIINGPPTCSSDAAGYNTTAGLEKATVTGSGSDYTGTAPRFNSSTCAVTETDKMLVHIFSTSPLTMRRCQAANSTDTPVVDANFNPASPTTGCQDFVQARPAETPASFEQITSLPAQPPCTTAARTRGRRVHLRFHSPVNEPLQSVVVKLGARKVFSYTYPAAVPRGTRIALPPAGGTLTIIVKTVSGRTFKKKKRYGPCLPVRRHHHHHHH